MTERLKLIFDTLQVVKDEIRENFPYRYMYVERCEDDIIAVLSKVIKEDVLIISSIKTFSNYRNTITLHNGHPILIV